MLGEKPTKKKSIWEKLTTKIMDYLVKDFFCHDVRHLVAVPDNARHHIRLEVVPRRMCCRRHWYVLAVIDAGCRRHLQERADVLDAPAMILAVSFE